MKNICTKRSTYILISCCLALFIAREGWANDPVTEELEKNGRIALEAKQYSTALDLFSEGASKTTDAKVKARFDFRQAVTLQQMVNTGGVENPEEKLKQSARLYDAYLEENPGSAATASNLAKVYETLGNESSSRADSAQAAMYLEKAAEYYQRAIAVDDSKRGFYLKNYAEFLERSDDWPAAKKVYAQFVQEQPLSPALKQSLTESYSKHGLDDLAQLLMEMLDAGYVQHAAESALNALDQSANETSDSRTDLLVVVCAALAQGTGERQAFLGSDLGIKTTDLASDSQLGEGAGEIIRLYQGQLLGASDYEWWVDRSSTFFESRGKVYPINVFRTLIRALGSLSKQSGELGMAESYFQLAARVGSEKFDIDPMAIRALVQMHVEANDLDKVEEVLESFQVQIYESKRRAYLGNQTEKKFLYHQTLGELYTLLEVWGDSGTVKSAIFQLERARQESRKLSANSAGPISEKYQFTPQMVEQLSKAYIETLQPAKSRQLRIEQAKVYKKAGDTEAERRVLAPVEAAEPPVTLPENNPNNSISGSETETETETESDTGTGSDFDCDTDVELNEPETRPDQHDDFQQVAQTNPTLQTGAVNTNPVEPEPVSDATVSEDYIGDDIRIAIGYDSETDLTGEFFWNFMEDVDSAYSVEAWKGDDSSGGIKFNFHWLADGVVAGQDEAGNPIYSDGKVRKLFIAADRNVYADGKVTFGGGSEHEDKFWSLYASKSTTGKRYLGQSIDIQEMIESGVIDNHQYTQVDTWTTTTDFFAHPYDWGVGFRVGRYFENSLIRLRGGFDYEDGDYSSHQLSAYASLDKRFKNSSQGLSFRAEVVRKSGDFEIDKNDLRLSAFWSWDFGTTFRPSAVYRNIQVETMPVATAAQVDQSAATTLTRVTRQFDLASSFELNKYELTDASKASLQNIVDELRSTRVAGKIIVTGHTCSLGSAEYNQKLSQRRADAAFKFLVNSGFDAEQLCASGKGETEPMYTNQTEEGRSMNRRVEVSFVAEEEVESDKTANIQPVIKWVQEQVPTEAAWIRRALRNPVSHKRTVDYYRYNNVTETHETERELINIGAEARDDNYSVLQDSTSNSLNVLDNDSDPEYDSLKIIAVSNPVNGTATISGGAVLYTPDPGFYGTDTFSYEIEDIYVNEPHPPGASSTAQVTIEVVPSNMPPVANDDNYSIAKNTYDQAFNVLENDSDPDDDLIRIISVGSPSHGTVSLAGDLVLYTPNPEFIGQDQFEYTITDDNGGESTALVTVDVVNQAPVAVDDWAEVWKNNRVTIDVLANDYDPDGDEISIVEIIQDEHPMGTVVDNGDGTLTYYPMKGWFGGDKFQYTISDGDLTSTAMVTIDVKGIPR